ncbi:prenyltransferase/squalene oxidase repeat-containing protein [Thermopirellula anaerolimosa]
MTDAIIRIHILRAIGSLKNMIEEMERKGLELKRLTKTAAILATVGVSRNSLPRSVLTRCLREQQQDGGWIGVTDTMWNAYFLENDDTHNHDAEFLRSLDYLKGQRTADGLWGRSARDMSRIPVTGMMLYLLPQLATPDVLHGLERLWCAERNTLTYKAAYVLMAMARCSYIPQRTGLIEETMAWLIENQRDDGSFAPWKSHPVASDVFCTSVALLGMAQYPQFVSPEAFQKAGRWLLETQLPTGIWPYHEIEDGASWALWALAHLASHFGKMKRQA